MPYIISRTFFAACRRRGLHPTFPGLLAWRIWWNLRRSKQAPAFTPLHVPILRSPR